MEEEFESALELIPDKKFKRNIAIATGEIAYGFIQSLADRLVAKCQGLSITVFAVKNEFFGGGVNVSGLLTGSDLIKALPDMSQFDELLIPCSMLRDGEDIFLDDITLAELSDKLKIEITPVINDGYSFCEKVLGTELEF